MAICRANVVIADAFKLAHSFARVSPKHRQVYSAGTMGETGREENVQNSPWCAEITRGVIVCSLNYTLPLVPTGPKF